MTIVNLLGENDGMTITRTAGSGQTSFDPRTVTVLANTLATTVERASGAHALPEHTGVCSHTGFPHAARKGCPDAYRMPGVLAVVVMLANTLGMAHRNDGGPFAVPAMDLAAQAYRHGWAHPTHVLTTCDCAATLPDGVLLRMRDGSPIARGSVADAPYGWASTGTPDGWAATVHGVSPDGCACGSLLPPHTVAEHDTVAATDLAIAEHEAGTLRDSVRATHA